MKDNISPKTFVKVADRRGQPVLGLWNRNGRFYFQTQLPGDKSPRKVALRNERDRPVADLKEAQKAIEKFRQDTADGVAPTKLRSPGFVDHYEAYLLNVKTTGAKVEKTLVTERAILKGWGKFFGNVPLTHLTVRRLEEYISQRKIAGLSNRTVNVDVLVLNSCLKYAVKLGVLRNCITKDWEILPYQAPKRGLRSIDELKALCAEATREAGGKPVYQSGQALSDYLKLMAFSGARRDSALAVEWDDVNWANRQLWLRKTKYSKNNVYVDFNEDLEAHLRDMQSRRVGDLPFLFPSSRYLESGASSQWATFSKVRSAVGLEDFHLHDLRHYFISHCVMAGIDFMTVAKWVGHVDGGVLIGRVYGHVSNSHGQAAAAKVSLSGNQPALKLEKGSPGDVKPAVQPEKLEPAGLAPVVNSPTTYACF